MGIVILGIAIADWITSDKIQDLKRQINDIVNQHKALSDKVQKISQDLQKLDLSQVSKRLDKVNSSITQNLKTILADQQTKIDLVKGIDTTKSTVDYQSLLSGIMNVLNVVMTVFSLIEIMCATNPATIAVSAVMLLLNGILGIFSLINNVKEIHELEDKKGQLQEYFRPGGQFEKDKSSMVTLTFQVVENFYIFVLNYTSMLNELMINIQLLSLSGKLYYINYYKWVSLAGMNPFDASFQAKCLQTYNNLVAIQNYSLDQKVTLSCKYLDDFEETTGVVGKLDIVKNFAAQLQANPQLVDEIKKFNDQIQKLTTLKGKFQNQFAKRLNYANQDLIEYDKDLLDDLKYQTKHIDRPQVTIVEVVSFYTRRFYADDPTGQTLYKCNLQDMYKKTGMMAYLGTTSNPNIIQLPQPDDQTLKKSWDLNRKTLQKLYSQQHPNQQFETKSLYMRMQDAQSEIDSNKTKLIYFYGIKVRNTTLNTTDTFQKQSAQLSEIQFPPIHFNMLAQADQYQTKEETDTDLKRLCNDMCFFINGIAYPERVRKFNITKDGDQYKAVLEWGKFTVKKQFMGKFITCNIVEGQVGQDQANIFHTEFIQQSNISAVFSYK